jgi:hypothetical protein
MPFAIIKWKNIRPEEAFHEGTWKGITALINPASGPERND